MKKIFILFFAFIAILNFQIQAQSELSENPGFGIKINISNYRFPSLQFETKLHKKKYIHFETSYKEANNKLSFDAISDKISEVHIFTDLRFYLNRTEPFQGFFLSPSLSLDYFRDQRFKTKRREKELYDEKTFYLGGGMTTGYQFLIKERILFDLHLGICILRQLIEKKDIAPEWNGFDDSLGEWRGVPRAGLSIGFRFG